MIPVKTKAEIARMRDAGRIAAIARATAGEYIREGVTTRFIDAKIKAVIRSHGAYPSFLGYGGFPASACISVNDEIIHGIPSDRVLKNGDIVKVDVGAYYRGYHGDCACTYTVGEVDEGTLKLIEVTKESFFRGIENAVPGKRIGDISSAIEQYVTPFGYSIVREYVGHGVGASLHEDPEVPNYGIPGRGPRLCEGMTIAVEPMVNAGTMHCRTLENNWTVVTLGGMMSSHYENTIAITENGPVILTDVN